MYAFKQIWIGCATILCCLTCVTSFSATSKAFSSRAQVKLVSPVSASRTGKAPDPYAYSEVSRKFRRDFYNHDSWLRARQKTRFIGTLSKIFDSGVVRQLLGEVMIIGGIATTVVLYNCLFVTGFTDFAMVQHPPVFNWGLPLMRLPLEPFSLSSPALSLLLGKPNCCIRDTQLNSMTNLTLFIIVFKTNTSYQRWDEARKAWGMVVNNSRSIARQTSAWVLQAKIPDSEKYRLIRNVADCVWLFPRSLQRHLWSPLEDTEPFAKACRERLSPKLAREMIDARHKPTRALFELSKAINELPLDTIQRSTIDQDVTTMCDALGACDRIFGSPVPSIYTRHTARFLELFMFFIPFALWQPFSFCWNNWFV
jgi:ion channel-forming bestrophin family protein